MPKTIYDERTRVARVDEALRQLRGDCNDCIVVAKFCDAHADQWRTVSEFVDIQARRLSAAIGLLLEAPAECSERAPLPGACGKCWTCRIDAFLRDNGLR